MDELKELDKLLEYLIQHPHPLPPSMGNLIRDANLNTDAVFTNKMIDKLIKDKYLEKSLIDYSTTFEGVIFSRYGGYVLQRKTILKIENRKDRRELMLIVGTWIAGIGAFALVAWEIYKTCYLHLG